MYRVRTKIRKEISRSLTLFAPNDPLYVFHHIPKCGGTSMLEVLRTWFITIEDYRTSWTTSHSAPADLRSLCTLHCLCGHFELEGVHLHQRYPEVFSSERYKVFTFVRDPLQLQLSLFRYEKEHAGPSISLEEHLSFRPNYIASILPATAENYKQIIDRYFFVGILEEKQLSLDILASLLGKRRKQYPWVNRTSKKNGGIEEVSSEILARFKRENELDYKIYNYCFERFQRSVAEQNAVRKSLTSLRPSAE